MEKLKASNVQVQYHENVNDSLDELFNLNSSKQKPTSWANRNLPKSFFEPSITRPCDERKPNEGKKDFVVSHSKANSSPACLGDLPSHLYSTINSSHTHQKSLDVPYQNAQYYPLEQCTEPLFTEESSQSISPGSQSNRPITCGFEVCELPEGYQMAVNDSNQVYFLDHKTQKTSWFDPRIPSEFQNWGMTVSKLEEIHYNYARKLQEAELAESATLRTNPNRGQVSSPGENASAQALLMSHKRSLSLSRAAKSTCSPNPSGVTHIRVPSASANFMHLNDNGRSSANDDNNNSSNSNKAGNSQDASGNGARDSGNSKIGMKVASGACKTPAIAHIRYSSQPASLTGALQAQQRPYGDVPFVGSHRTSFPPTPPNAAAPSGSRLPPGVLLQAQPPHGFQGQASGGFPLYHHMRQYSAGGMMPDELKTGDSSSVRSSSSGQLVEGLEDLRLSKGNQSPASGLPPLGLQSGAGIAGPQPPAFPPVAPHTHTHQSSLDSGVAHCCSLSHPCASAAVSQTMEGPHLCLIDSGVQPMSTDSPTADRMDAMSYPQDELVCGDLNLLGTVDLAEIDALNSRTTI